MSTDDYYKFFRDLGYKPTGEGTILTELWKNEHGTEIMFTRPEQLSERDRIASIERMKMYLGVGYPKFTGVH